MALATRTRPAALTLGPVLFNWQPERWRDFYFRIADEAPVETVYLGEAVCSKRAPLFDEHFEAVAARLEAAGKTVVLSTLAEVFLPADRKLVDGRHRPGRAHGRGQRCLGALSPGRTAARYRPVHERL